MTRKHRDRLIAIGLAGCSTAAVVAAQPTELPVPAAPNIDFASNLAIFWDAAIRLPLATLLGAALALRPRRRGTPRRPQTVIETQIVLALIGALVMLVVGASLARAFGVVGVAGLIRYRAKIEDPKDAVVMLSTLGIGLASGVGLYLLALFATVFTGIVLALIESLAPDAVKHFALKVTSKEAAKLQPHVERLLRAQQARFEQRTSSSEEICYDVQLPYYRRPDRITKTILRLKEADGAAVEWDEKKKTG